MALSTRSSRGLYRQTSSTVALTVTDEAGVIVAATASSALAPGLLRFNRALVFRIPDELSPSATTIFEQHGDEGGVTHSENDDGIVGVPWDSSLERADDRLGLSPDGAKDAGHSGVRSFDFRFADALFLIFRLRAGYPRHGEKAEDEHDGERSSCALHAECPES